jgi:hypothetical protein
VKEFAIYTAARFGIFVVLFAGVLGLWILVAGTPVPLLWPLLIAAVLSTFVSAFVLRSMRERVTGQLQRRGELAAQRNAAVRAKDARMRAARDEA